MSIVKFNKEWFNPLYFILNDLIKDDSIRTILVYGGKSSAKTFSISQLLSKECLIHNASTIAFRKESTTIPTTLKESFNKAIDSIYLSPAFERQDRRYLCNNGNKIILKGLDMEEKAKGVEGFKYLYLDELNHFDFEEYRQFNLSLRGILGQKIFASWNPVSENSWVKKDLVDKYIFVNTKYVLPCPSSFIKRSTCGRVVLIKTTYEDNYWITGHPSGKYGYRDENLIAEYEALKYNDYNAYRVNVLGEWGIRRTGGEFFKYFDETKHVQPIKQKPKVIHICLDNNNNPYVTQTLWQVFPDEKKIVQVDEILCRAPINNAPKAARKLLDYLIKIDYGDVLFLHGDPSIKNRSTVDENNLSFYEKFEAELTAAGVKVVNRVEPSAPEVALSGAFINEILETNLYGWQIIIGENCKESIEDYLIVKEDVDGSMKKPKIKDKDTGVTYEQHGHISDTLRYIMVSILRNEFNEYKSRRSKLFVIGV